MVNNKQNQFFNNSLFPNIFKTFRMAIQPSKLIIVFCALTLICITGWVMDFSKTVVATAGANGKITELQIYIANPSELPDYIEEQKEKGSRTGVFSALWQFGTARFHIAMNSLFAFDLPGVAKNAAECFKAARWAIGHHFIYCILFFLLTFVVVSVTGGAICRISALQFAQGEKPGLMEALRFSIAHFKSFFMAPIAPVAIILLLGLCIFVLGLIGNIPFAGEILVGVFMLLTLLAGAFISFFLIGTFAGFNLMFPSVVYDGSDCFDAVGRSFSYIYSKPWRMGFYTTIAAFYGAICYCFVRLCAFLLLLVTRQFLQLGLRAQGSNEQVNKLAAIWPEPSFVNLIGSAGLAENNWSESFSAFLIYIVLLVVIGLLVSFVVSFYFSANTIIYGLMRNSVDNTALDDVYRCIEDVQTPAATKAEPEPAKANDQKKSEDSSTQDT